MIRVDDLLILAGPTCVGKTTLLERIRRGRAPGLAAELRLEAVGDPPFMDAVRVDALAGDRKLRHLDRLVMHYDTCRPARLSLEGFAGDPVLGLLGEARNKVIVTLRADAGELCRRLNLRRDWRLRGWRRFGVSAMQRAEWTRLEQLYGNPAELARHYESWSEFCTGHPTAQRWYASGMEREPVLESQPQRKL